MIDEWQGMLKEGGREPRVEQTELNRAIGQQFVQQLSDVVAVNGGKVHIVSREEAEKELERVQKCPHRTDGAV